MALKRGEPSALMTKLLNESTGYITTLAALSILSLMILKKEVGDVGIYFLVVFTISSIVLFCYWIGHFVESCVQFSRVHKDSRSASVHAFIILMSLLFSYVGALVLATWTLFESLVKSVGMG